MAKRILTGIGAAAIAALLMSSVGAGVASADDYTVETSPATLTGKLNGTTHIVKVDGGEIKCTTGTSDGTMAAQHTSFWNRLRILSGCTFAGLVATVSMNECVYVTKVSAGAGNTSGTVDISCPAGKEITVKAPSVGTTKCTVHIPAQTGLGPVSYSNVGSGTTREIIVTSNVTNLKYSQTAGTAETGNCATADSTTGGTETSQEAVTAENELGGTHIALLLT